MTRFAADFIFHDLY